MTTAAFCVQLICRVVSPIFGFDLLVVLTILISAILMMSAILRGCDGSNLLDDTANFTGEKTARPNLNSLRGFDVIDEIKAAVNSACYGNVVSCADILAIAARDSVNILGAPWYQVQLGRRDSLTASLNDANNDIPPPFFNLSSLLSNFQSHSLDLKDLVVLSGGHTIGLARCTTFVARIYNDTNINPNFDATLKNICPVNSGGNKTFPLDTTTTVFDTVYYQDLLQQKGLLHSDQQLFDGGNSETDDLVRYYSNNPYAFGEDFGVSMLKMGNLKPLTGSNGQIRMNCRRVN
ncbi:Peroxidase 4 [Camellia lanceoleosa]|uniref:Peroxidase 4 n=1 Tax=Camellia lanceoleosa TaxID=1840588 RepID=A0ACC0F690_9ERIC|nr:Peroxidase 4 [Camellia lanceoleosa]